MFPDQPEKDASIRDVLDRLARVLGPDAFVLADHWEADLCAVGIAAPWNAGVLAYISTHGLPPDTYVVHLELPPPADSDFPYTATGMHSGVSFAEMQAIVADHLSASGRRSA